jgi:hypothetical protein
MQQTVSEIRSCPMPHKNSQISLKLDQTLLPDHMRIAGIYHNSLSYKLSNITEVLFYLIAMLAGLDRNFCAAPTDVSEFSSI